MPGSLLTQVPFSEITATLEALAQQGVTSADLGRLRKDPLYAQHVAHLMRFGSPQLLAKRLPFMTISLDPGRSAENYITAIDPHPVLQTGWAQEPISEEAKGALRRIDSLSQRIELELFLASTRELTGTEKTAVVMEVIAGAERAGWEVCLPQVAPELFLRIREQSLLRSWVMGMKPLTGPCGRLCVFDFSPYDYKNRTLGAAGDSCQWLADQLWVFCRRKMSPSD